MTTLTPEEEKEFTYLNAIAFDVARKRGQETKMIPPFWLCHSYEAKAELRKLALEVLGQMSFTAFTEESAERYLKRHAYVLDPQVALWKAMETEAKGYREAGNPRAFFCEEVNREP